MAFTFQELEETGSWQKSKDNEERVYIYRVPTDDIEVAKGYGPAIGHERNGLVLKRKVVQYAGSGYSKLNLTYGQREEPDTQVGSFVRQFDTAAQQSNVIRAYSQDHEPAAADVGNLINVTPDGVHGVDIYVPTFEWTETRWFAASTVKASYVRKLFRLTGRVNKYDWKIFDKGEALFLGANGRQKSGEEWEIVYRFLGSPNENFVVSDLGVTVNKEGWDYVWYDTTNSVTGGRRVPEVTGVHYARVYERADFWNLGIGA